MHYENRIEWVGGASGLWPLCDKQVIQNQESMDFDNGYCIPLLQSQLMMDNSGKHRRYQRWWRVKPHSTCGSDVEKAPVRKWTYGYHFYMELFGRETVPLKGKILLFRCAIWWNCMQFHVISVGRKNWWGAGVEDQRCEAALAKRNASNELETFLPRNQNRSMQIVNP